MSRFDLVELERTHERRSRRMTAADRAPIPFVGSAVAEDIEAAREAIAVVVERAEEARNVALVDPRSTVIDLTGREPSPAACALFDEHIASGTFTPLTDDPNWKLRRYTFDAAPGFLIKVIRTTLYLADRPCTAYEIAKTVQLRHAGRWKSRSIRNRVGEPKTGLFVWDLNGLSDDNEPCRRYWLEAPA